MASHFGYFFKTLKEKISMATKIEGRGKALMARPLKEENFAAARTDTQFIRQTERQFNVQRDRQFS